MAIRLAQAPVLNPHFKVTRDSHLAVGAVSLVGRLGDTSLSSPGPSFGAQALVR